jgi:hypothetical protein
MTANAGGPGYAATTIGINGTSNANWDLPGANRGEWIGSPPTDALTYEVCTPINVSLGGDNAQCEVFFRVKRIEVVQKGSGYASTQTLSWHTAGSTGSPYPGVPTFALTTDSGRPGSATNQENAIIIHANTDDNGTKIGDIIKQSNTHSYKVKTADGIRICKLEHTTDSPAVGYAYIIATAANGSTYYVTKLTAHRATLVHRSGTNVPALDGHAVPWTFDSTANGRVIIENA